MQANGRFVVAMVAAAVLLGFTAVLGIVIGSTSVGIDDVLALAFGADAEQTAANVIWNIMKSISGMEPCIVLMPMP